MLALATPALSRASARAANVGPATSYISGRRPVMFTTPPKPMASVKTTTIHTCTSPSCATTAMATATGIDAACVASTRRRRSTRSLSAPATSPPSSIGANTQAPTSWLSTGLSVSWVTTGHVR